MNDRKKFSDMAKFIKRLGDERVSCQVSITIKSIKFDSNSELTLAQTHQGPYAIQILRGPLRSETKEIHLPTDAVIVPIDLVFSRLTTMYKLETGTF